MIISLKRSLQISITCLIIIIGVIISQFVINQYSKALIDSAVSKAENIAHKLAIDTTNSILINDFINVQHDIDAQTVSTPSVGYIFIEKKGKVLVHTFDTGFPVSLIGINSPTSDDRGHLKKIISEKGIHYLDIAWPIFNGKAGVLRLGLLEAPYQEQVRELWLKMNVITLIVIIFALGIIHLFILRLTRPLSNLTVAVEKIDEENLGMRIKVKGREEVTKVVTAFNKMLNRIEDYTDQLNISHEDIKSKHDELNRAHLQQRAFFNISKAVSGLSKLNDICVYLINDFKKILKCKNMAFLIFFENGENHLITLGIENKFESASLNTIKGMLYDAYPFSYLKQKVFEDIPLPANLKAATNLAVFPMRDHGRLMGVFIVGCRAQCICNTEELEIIHPILDQSSNAIKRTIELEEEIQDLHNRLETTNEFSGLIGKDPKMQAVFKLVENIAATDTSVLIQGESGTGKELVAQAIHDLSPRKSAPFIILNCSAYPSTLLESELFGHEKGAFTGAVKRKIGRFEQAIGGTIFLDEIGEISQSAQIKLLRVLQSRKFERLGGEKTVSVDIRILAATNKNLSHEVQNGNFREDLFYRLNVIPITLPPLRDRHNDIIILARHFLRQYQDEQGKIINDLTTDALQILIKHQWPGNVRELENTIEHAVVLANGNYVDVTDLPDSVYNNINNKAPEPFNTLGNNEKRIIIETLEHHRWNKTKTAEKLEISRGTLYQKIKKYNIKQ